MTHGPNLPNPSGSQPAAPMLRIETTEPGGFVHDAGGRGLGAIDPSKALDQATSLISSIGRTVANSLHQFGPQKPSSYEVTFGIKITAEGDVWVARASSEAQLEVKMSWDT